MSHIARSSFIVTLCTIFGMCLSFLSNVVIAAAFGAGKEMDIYFAATTLPFFIASILSSALNFTFIPVFAEYRETRSDEPWKVISSFVNLSIVVTTALCVIGILCAHGIMKAIAPGFTEEKLLRSAELLRWLLPMIIFIVINELLASVYYSHQRFVIPTLNKIVSPLITMLFVLLFHNVLSTKSIVLALITAAFIQTLLLINGFFKTRDFRYSFEFAYKHPGVIKILKLMTPLVLGMIVYRATPLCDRYFLSQLAVGSISHVGYAMKLLSILPPMVISGISIAIFPVMSKYAAEKKWDALNGIMTKGMKMGFFLSIPFVVFLGIYGKSVVQMIYQRGAFLPEDTIEVYRVFIIYLLSLPASIMGTIVSQGFYALQKNNIIAGIGAVLMGLYVALCIFLIRYLNYIAIPVAYVVYHIVACIVTNTALRLKAGVAIRSAIIPFLLKNTLLALSVSLFVYPIGLFLGGDIFISVALCGTGFVVYFFGAKLFFAKDEADLIWRTVFFKEKQAGVS